MGSVIVIDIDSLNFHHLRYFWSVAKDGNLTRTARRLRVAQSALSAQIRQLEAQVGQPLFARQGRGLALTEAGRLTAVFAGQIFATGGELLATLNLGRPRDQVLRVDAVATLSRNFQRSFVRPLLSQNDVSLRLGSGGFNELLSRLANHEVDIVLANRPAARTTRDAFRSRLLARQPVSIVSSSRQGLFRFPRDLAGRAMILPGTDSQLRGEFDALCERLGVSVRIVAEVDDMATMRLLVRDTDAAALVPSVVVRDELSQGVVHELCVVPRLFEAFYGITIDRRFQHPLLRALLDRDEADLLGTGAVHGSRRASRPPRKTPAHER